MRSRLHAAGNFAISYRVIRRRENIRLAGIHLTLHSGNNPIARANDVTAFLCVDPAVNVHYLPAMLAFLVAAHIWSPEIADDAPLTEKRWICVDGMTIILRMVA